jgi:ADP-ribose pyrophosphatase YjhB (NUDIX family)
MAETSASERDVFALLDEVRAIARSGLAYSDNPFERARCERLLELASEQYAAVLGIEPEAVRQRFIAETGYATAKVGTDGAVFDDDGRVLLIRRTDDERWGLVAGWVDPNEPPEATIVREFAEELGVEAQVEELVGTVFRPANAGYGPHSCVSLVYLCSIGSRAFRPQPHEVLDVAWLDIDEVSGWHLNHEQLARFAHAGWLGRRRRS